MGAEPEGYVGRGTIGRDLPPPLCSEGRVVRRVEVEMAGELVVLEESPATTGDSIAFLDAFEDAYFEVVGI